MKRIFICKTVHLLVPSLCKGQATGNLEMTYLDTSRLQSSNVLVFNFDVGYTISFRISSADGDLYVDVSFSLLVFFAACSGFLGLC